MTLGQPLARQAALQCRRKTARSSSRHRVSRQLSRGPRSSNSSSRPGRTAAARSFSRLRQRLLLAMAARNRQPNHRGSTMMYSASTLKTSQSLSQSILVRHMTIIYRLRIFRMLIHIFTNICVKLLELWCCTVCLRCWKRWISCASWCTEWVLILA